MRAPARTQRPGLGTGVLALFVLIAAGSAHAASRSDLTVARVTTTGVTVTPGSCTASGCTVRVSGSATIVNRGRARAARARVGFFVSRDARRDRGDGKGGRAWVQALGSGRARTAAATATLAGVSPGVYRLIACADVTGRVRERDERNNCRAGRPFEVQGATAPAPVSTQPPAACQEPAWHSDMCAEVAKAMADRTFFDMADAVTFVLLYQHHRTKQAIPSSIAAGIIDPLRTAWDPVRGQAGLSNYRVAGFLNFWVYGSYAGVDWARFPDALDTQDQFLSWWQTYGIVQGTARQNAINNSLNAIIQSEAAWQKAFDDWKAYDLKLVTAQQYSDATVFAHRTYEDAQTAVLRAENAVKAP